MDWKKIPWHFCCDGDPGSFFLIRTFNLTEKCLHLQIQDSSWHSSAWCISQITSLDSCFPLNGKSEQHTKISYVLAVACLLHTSKVRTQMPWLYFMLKEKKEKKSKMQMYGHIPNEASSLIREVLLPLRGKFQPWRIQLWKNPQVKVEKWKLVNSICQETWAWQTSLGGPGHQKVSSMAFLMGFQ